MRGRVLKQSGGFEAGGVQTWVGRQELESHYATKAELEKKAGDVEKAIAQSETRQLKWLITTTLLALAALSGVFLAIEKLL